MSGATVEEIIRSPPCVSANRNEWALQEGGRQPRRRGTAVTIVLRGTGESNSSAESCEVVSKTTPNKTALSRLLADFQRLSPRILFSGAACTRLPDPECNSSCIELLEVHHRTIALSHAGTTGPVKN